MNNIKSTFNIKDLENLSGIKAHTIRIWEKRYNLLEPMRSDTNIRMYDIQNLQKLLNVVLLTKFGYKISKISTLSIQEIEQFVIKIQNEKTINNHVLSAFKMAMLNFDQSLFLRTYNELISTKDFNTIFFDTFIPLLEEIGTLWTTNTITPAHEHFISNLIKQKILIQIENNLNKLKINSEKTFVLYLPYNEIHEIGILFLHQQISAKGYHSIYLGSSLPFDSLLDLNGHFKKITYVTYLTVAPENDEVDNYIKQVSLELLNENGNELVVLGRKTELIHPKSLSENIKIYKNPKDFVDLL